MIYFITNSDWHLKHYRKNLYDNIEVTEDNSATLDFFIDWLDNHMDEENPIIGYDVESNGLDAYMNDTHIRIIGNEVDQFLLHTPYCNTNEYINILTDIEATFLGHGIKFDIKFTKTEDDILIKKVYDTMIAEQRIYMKSGLRFGLDFLCERYLEVYPDSMDKSIRMEFVGKDVNTFKLKPRHLYYGAGDVKHLFAIKEHQEKRIKMYDLHFLIYDIEFPLIHIIAKAELEGFIWNEEEWMKVYKENDAKRFDLACKLDKEFRALRDKLLTKEDDNRVYLIGGKWDNERKKITASNFFNDDGTTNNLDLFGQPMKVNTYLGSKAKVQKKIKKAPNNINFSSETEIMEIFGRLEQPLLTKAGNLVIPTFTKTHKVDKSNYSYMTGEDAFHEYLTQLPNTIMKPFIELLIEHRGYNTACNNFGANFKLKINTVTGKLHTLFRQCRADTGRFQSGGGKSEPDKPNFQNIPSRASYAIRLRNCFMCEDTHSVGTHDLSGAELIIMCSLSQDMKLLEIARGDMHSFVAQNSWRRIFASRATNLIKEHDGIRELEGADYTDVEMIKTINENIRLSKEFIVDKTTKKLRGAFKPMTFGTIYGMYAAKAGKTLNIIKEEGQIVIDFIKRTFPDVFRMVEFASAFAKQRGFLVLNTRTNSRAWFPDLIKLIRGEFNERDHFGYISNSLSQARNIKIQGTQADMIKECSVELQRWIDANDYTNDIIILSWVHDEIVDKHPKYLDGKSDAWKEWSKDNYLSFLNDNGELIEVNNFPELKRLLMIEVCNRYLENVSMDCEYDVEPYWTK